MDPSEIQAADDRVGILRALGEDYTANFPVVPNEVTNWLDEQRAITETCALADLSHHMTSLRVEGPDALEFLRHLSANSVDSYPVGTAKQIVMCSPTGHLIGDGPVMRLADEVFYGPGVLSANWTRFQAETGDWDVAVETEPRTSAHPGDPAKFVFQVQGPTAGPVLEQVTDADLEAIGFYRFEEIDLAGVDAIALGHGMSTEAGFEFIGPFEESERVRDAIVDAGEEYGLARLGSKAYHTQSVRLGWLPPGVPPIYDVPAMADYRTWLTADSREATYSIDGSFDSDDITDYYMSPLELGYGKLVSFDHDFIGRDALEAQADEPHRELVSLQWADEDVVDIYASLFGEGPTQKFMGLPRIGWARANYDRVERGGELVGTSHSRAYQWDLRSVVSLCRLDPDLTEPGTEVELVWGEPRDSPNPKAERHEQTRVQATVREAPYSTDRRQDD